MQLGHVWIWAMFVYWSRGLFRWMVQRKSSTIKAVTVIHCDVLCVFLLRKGGNKYNKVTRM